MYTLKKERLKELKELLEGKVIKKTLNSSNVPKAGQKNVKSTDDFKKALEKQKKLDKERKKVSKMSWNHIFINPAVVAPIAILIGFTVAKLLKFPKLIFA